MLLGGQGTRAIGELSLSSGTTSILFAIVPLFAIIINYVWLGQRLPKKVFMWLVFGLAGVILLVLTIWNEGNESFRSSLFLLFGTLELFYGH
jgi:drug/metabolite transporter (DMT)-like permease